MPRVGVFARNNYSLYWASLAWEAELGRKIELKFVAPEAIPATDICYYVIQTSFEDELSPEVLKLFSREDTVGKWGLYKRISCKDA